MNNNKEEWARRKYYLLRSLFDDAPLLSTIIEENDSLPLSNTRSDNFNPQDEETSVNPSSIQSLSEALSSSKELTGQDVIEDTSNNSNAEVENTQSDESSENLSLQNRENLPAENSTPRTLQRSVAKSQYDRPDSPLPDLIVEIIRKRLDDEPEEFYDSLLKIIRKQYRRDFLHLSRDSDDLDSINDEYVDYNRYEDIIMQDDDESIQSLLLTSHKSNEEERFSEHCYDIINPVEERRLQETSASKSTQSSSSTTIKDTEEEASNENEHELNVFEESFQDVQDNRSTQDSSIFEDTVNNGIVIARNEHNNEEVSDPEVESYQGNSHVNTSLLNKTLSLSSKSSDEEEDNGDLEDIVEEEIMELEENNDASSITESPMSIPKPDAMRRQEIRIPLLSLENQDVEKSLDSLVSCRRERVVFMETSHHDSENLRESCDFRRTFNSGELNAFSTPVSSFGSRSSSSQSSKRSSIRFEPYSARSRSKSLKRCDRETQTSFSEDESDYGQFWGRFFRGPPIFYRLRQV